MSTKIVVGLVAGNFDVIHPGYVKMFEDAKKNACDYLVVALQSDPTIDRPEKSKPVQSVEEREFILNSIKHVDEIIHYNTEAELLKILTEYNYDVRILGTDYNVPGKKFTGSDLNKKIYFHARDHTYSATDLKNRIAQQNKKKKKRKRDWNKNRDILKSIANPSKDAYEIKMKVPELTFEGVRGQPDFGHLYITFYPSDKVIELKSLKEYFFAFRSQIYSYERILNVIYDDMMAAYDPARLRLVLVCNPRGGISSKLTVDSDWGVRGGKDAFEDWVGQKEEW